MMVIVMVIVVHRLTAPALVLGHMNRYVHLLDDRHVHFLVDRDVLDHGHMLDDVHRYRLLVMMMDGVNLVRYVYDNVLAV